MAAARHLTLRDSNACEASTMVFDETACHTKAGRSGFDTMKRFATALLLGMISLSPVWADDSGPQHCGLFCKLWRNVSGKVQTPVQATTWDEGALRVPTPEEEARRPRTDDLVVQHGDLIRKSRAERQREAAVAAAQVRRIDALRQAGGETAVASRTAQARAH